MDETLQTKLHQKESELNATYDERLRNSSEREADLQRQLNTTKAQLRDLRQSHAARLLRAQQASQAAIDSFPDPVLVIDQEGRVEMANPATAAAKGGDAMPGMSGMSMDVMTGGPSATVSFPYGFPKAGRYRIFAQMKRGGVIETGVFDAEVVAK